jgi:hypothetical protein
MKRKRYTEQQIIAILKEHETGMKTAVLVPEARQGAADPGKDIDAGERLEELG